MSKSDWLHSVAIRACLIAAIWLLPVLALGQQRPDDGQAVGQYSEPDTDPEKDKAAFDAWFWREAPGSPETYRDICEHPKDRDYADLCQQWRSAEAAKQQLYWSQNQFWGSAIQAALAALGLIGLIATIIYTHRTLRLSTQTSRAQLRAYVAVEHARICKNPHTEGMEIHLSFKNFGVTPAKRIIFKLGHALRQRIDEDEILPLTDSVTFPEVQIPPGHTYAIRIPFDDLKDFIEWPKYVAKRQRVYVWGRFDYRDVFDEPHWMTIQLVHILGSVREFANCKRGNTSSD